MTIQINDRIKINKGKLCGVIRYIGKVKNKEGTWIGLELEEPKGSNNGTINGEKYFTCAPNHGMFVKYKNLDKTLIKEEKDILEYEKNIIKNTINDNRMESKLGSKMESNLESRLQSKAGSYSKNDKIIKNYNSNNIYNKLDSYFNNNKEENDISEYEKKLLNRENNINKYKNYNIINDKCKNENFKKEYSIADYYKYLNETKIDDSKNIKSNTEIDKIKRTESFLNNKIKEYVSKDKIKNKNEDNLKHIDNFKYDNKAFSSLLDNKSIFENKSLFDTSYEEFLEKEIEKYKQLLSILLDKTTSSLNSIQESLNELQNRILKLQNRKIINKNSSERERVLFLVINILKGLENNESIEEYFIEYKTILNRYNIDLDRIKY